MQFHYLLCPESIQVVIWIFDSEAHSLERPYKVACSSCQRGVERIFLNKAASDDKQFPYLLCLNATCSVISITIHILRLELEDVAAEVQGHNARALSAGGCHDLIKAAYSNNFFLATNLQFNSALHY